MLTRLETAGLVAREPYHGVRLTPDGERVALRVIRRHRLVELFLAEALALPWMWCMWRPSGSSTTSRRAWRPRSPRTSGTPPMIRTAIPSPRMP